MNTFNKACKRLLDSVWTMTYIMTNDDTVHVLAFNREDADGYEFEKQIPKLRANESEERILESIEVDGMLYDVDNKKHIFSYS